jgi:gas vesicle protein
VTETSTEISSKQRELQQIQEALKEKPQDPDLLNQQTKLSGEIAELVKEQQQAEQDQVAAEQEKRDNDRDSNDTSNDRTEAEKELQERRRRDFARGERV